jgi:hypothetical protein
MILAISGRMGSGKDTVGQIIQYLTRNNTLKNITYEAFCKYYTLETNWEIKKYSDKLKDIVCILIGCTREQLEDQKFKETPLGEEWWIYEGKYIALGIKRDDDIYPYTRNNNYNGIYCPPEDYDVIKTTPRMLLQKIGTDLFRNQLHPNIWLNSFFSDYTEDCNWIITDSRFPNDVERTRGMGGVLIRVNRSECEGRENEHASETALDNYEGFNYIINNNGTIEELIEKVKVILIKENIIE